MRLQLVSTNDRWAFATPGAPLLSRPQKRGGLPPRPARYVAPIRVAPRLGLGTGGSRRTRDFWRAPRRSPQGSGGGSAGGGAGHVSGTGSGAPPGARSGDQHAQDPSPRQPIAPELTLILREAGREFSSLPVDVRTAVLDGRVLPDVLRNVLRVEALPILGYVASIWPALRNRLVANARFPLQLGVELTVGFVTKTLAEVSTRGERFWKEFDLYTSDIALEIVGDAMLVWLLSPSALFKAASGPRSITGIIDRLPKHFLQSGSFSASQRASAFLYKGGQFALVGFVSSLIGHSVTTALVKRRKALEARNFPTRRISDDNDVELAPVFPTSVAWGGFMFCSSNPRYQLVNGIEQRILFPLLERSPFLSTGVSFGLRFFNCFVGGLHWIPFARFFGIQ